MFDRTIEPHILIDMSYIKRNEIEFIITEIYCNEKIFLESYEFNNASDKMLGFLADYQKLKVTVKLKDGSCKKHYFFLKAIPKTNEAKAELLIEWKLFDKEIVFYRDIKKRFQNQAIKPWSPDLITVIDEAMVFQDMNAFKYKSRDKFRRFDIDHTVQCLKTLARFHASSIIYEEKRTNELGRPYSLEEDYGEFLNDGGYTNEGTWFKECKIGALQAIKEYSKFKQDKNLMSELNQKWDQVWVSAVKLNEHTERYYNVLSHRDLWNNNILFHYEKNDCDSTPDDCYFIDFQAIKRLPPASDIMVMLYCNLDPNLREDNLSSFLKTYYEELSVILLENEIDINDIVSMNELYETAEIYRKWAAVVCACLIPQFWISDDLTTEIFTDNERYQRIMCQDKGSFIKSMIEKDKDYKEKVIQIFNEIIERYCIG